MNCFCNTITGSQGGIINKHRNLKHKKLECNVSTHFNKQCSSLDIIPKFVNITNKNTSPGSEHTQQKTPKLRIKGDSNIFIPKKNCCV
jgi:hypothetical protein